MVTIVDYNVGNTGSIANILRHIGIDSTVSSSLNDVEKADKLILPGVGSFDQGMENLEKLNLLPVLHKRVLEDKTPVLGICLGMQLMTQGSEEGRRPGLGWIDAETLRFDETRFNTQLRLPHMGWNQVHQQKTSDLFVPINGEIRFYFVHTYHVVCHKPQDVLTTTHHGYDFVSSFQVEHIIGVQFHPEKSHRFGMDFMERFAGT